MTTRNWRTKNLRGGCNHSPSICSSYPEPYVDPYIPTTLTTLSFTNIGNTDWTVPAYVTSVEYLVVGGGGGGGGNASDGMGPTYSPAISYGGNGIDSNLSSSVVTYGTGGNGGRVNTSIAGTNGTANTGNGGGGASAVSSDGKSGGSGGSGIVILKYYV